ncbi:exodeoxyribonuclease VII large subunit [Xanthomonadaceae bacterium JHOS43]|nr:exodeoxyribonuclease VII large subunit [Xanthomonadaceae bacterium JHOS43]MCX7563837.1 exodeoxyribonuclease VII large subunit [Xanthomonadaceae bacterium XH05]
MPESPRHILMPSQINTLAREMLEGAFGMVWIEGELGGVSRPASGHLYFALKDARAQVRCALFKPKSQWLAFRPVDGMQVLARGRVTLYEPRGEYQIIIDHLEEAGEGALRRAFEQLKARLDAEGLFDPARKHALPSRIARIGVLSSPGGAAVHDVLTVLRRRFALIDVELLPVPVQGPLAASEIARMLARADQSGRYDVLLVTRGGGSLEDLAAFNDEALARAIAATRTPVVSAVGHEIDVSIADLVADLRAATPSAAAELLSRDGGALRLGLTRQRAQLDLSMRRAFERGWLRLDPLQHRIAAQHPAARLARGAERLGALHHRLRQDVRESITPSRVRLERLALRLAAQRPALRLTALAQANQRAAGRIDTALRQRLIRDATRVAALGRALHAVSPLATLQRGYAILLDQHGRSVRHAGELQPGERLTARLADGERRLRVEDLGDESA